MVTYCLLNNLWKVTENNRRLIRVSSYVGRYTKLLYLLKERPVDIIVWIKKVADATNCSYILADVRFLNVAFNINVIDI